MSEMKPSRTKGKTNWEKLRSRRKSTPAPSEKDRTEAREFWASADVVIPEGKTRMTVRFDSDLVEWFKSYGPKYQTRMNAALRQFTCNQEAQGSAADVTRISHFNKISAASGMREHSAAEYLEALNQLGKICMQKGDYESASEYFQEAVNFYRREIDVDHLSSELRQSSSCSEATHSRYQIRREVDQSSEFSKSGQGQSDPASQPASKQEKSRSPKAFAKRAKPQSARKQSVAKKNVSAKQRTVKGKKAVR